MMRCIILMLIPCLFPPGTNYFDLVNEHVFVNSFVSSLLWPLYKFTSKLFLQQNWFGAREPEVLETSSFHIYLPALTSGPGPVLVCVAHLCFNGKTNSVAGSDQRTAFIRCFMETNQISLKSKLLIYVPFVLSAFGYADWHWK